MAGILDKIKQAYTKAVQSSTPTVSDIASGNYAGSATAKATPTATNKAAVTVSTPTPAPAKTVTPTVNNSAQYLMSNQQPAGSSKPAPVVDAVATAQPANTSRPQSVAVPPQMSNEEAARLGRNLEYRYAEKDDANLQVLKDLNDLGLLGGAANSSSDSSGSSGGYKGSSATATENQLASAYAAALAEQTRIMQQAQEEQARLLQEQYDRLERQRRSNLEATIKANNDDKERSLREAYISNMLAQRRLPQQLKVNGISGGATESVLADIQNTYMNNRNNIERNVQNANAQARLAFDNGAADDYNDYLTKRYNLETTKADNALKAAAASQAAAAAKTSSSTSKKRSGTSSNRVANTNRTASESDIVQNLIATYKARGYNDNYITSLLKQAGYIS